MRRLAVVGAALGLVAVACGGGGSTAVTVVRDAPQKTTSARTSRVDLLIERPKTEATPTAFNMHITGEVDYQARRGHMSFDLSALGLSGAPVDAVFDGTTVYEKLPAALMQGVPGLSAAKPWLKIDAEAAGRTLGVSGLGAVQSGDPSETLEYLRGASNDLTRVGNEAVRGASTTHYKVTLDLNKAAGASASAKQAIQSLVKVLGFSKLPADVWIDAQGRLRRLKYSADLSKARGAASAAAASGTLTFTLELFDFSVPVQVSLPAPAQVVDLASITGQGK